MKKMYVTYNSVTSLLSIFRRNRPTSCISTKLNYYCVIINNQSRDEIRALPISKSFEKGISSLIVNYHKVKINLNFTDNDLQQ